MKITRAIVRETGVVDNMGCVLMICVKSPYTLEMWEKKKRTRYSVTWGEVWGLIVRNRLAEARKRLKTQRRQSRDS